MKKTTLKDYLSEQLSEDELNLVNRAFEIVGDIAIIEVPEKLKTHEKIIGEALLKVNKSLKTVLKKSGIHHGEFRTQNLIYIAGENKKDTIYKENGIQLKINPETVYFSSKLSTEREQLMQNLEPNKRILVMFSGCGPYTFVALKKQPNISRITSVEINPEGHKYALQNLQLNKNILKKSELFKKTIEFLKTNHLPIYEKRILENLNNLKINFINDDVKKIIYNLNLTTYNETISAYDNYTFRGNIKNVFDNLTNIENNQLFLDINKLLNKDSLIYFIILFSYKFTFICKINNENYVFDNNLKKAYLLNYLENNSDIKLTHLYDEIFMPLPKDAEHFLDCAFKTADKYATIHMYDFIHENDFPNLTENKVLEAAKQLGKKVQILQTRKVGQYSPRKYRVCCDFKILE